MVYVGGSTRLSVYITRLIPAPGSVVDMLILKTFYLGIMLSKRFWMQVLGTPICLLMIMLQ